MAELSPLLNAGAGARVNLNLTTTAGSITIRGDAEFACAVITDLMAPGTAFHNALAEKAAANGDDTLLEEYAQIRAITEAREVLHRVSLESSDRSDGAEEEE